MKCHDRNEQGMCPLLRHEVGGPRYYLAGKPLHAGDLLEFRRPDGGWELAHYEYFWDRRASILDAYLVCRAPDGNEQTLPAHNLLLRWPVF